MKEYAFRLVNGDDLKLAIEEKCQLLNIDTAIVLSSVGSISHLNIRLADAIEYLDEEDDYEILSLNGTISKGKAHLHISVADEDGTCFGGHLMPGTIINTTCELVLGILQEYSSNRVFDEDTGYNEIVFWEESND